jgi:gliding motility-associated-like protein
MVISTTDVSCFGLNDGGATVSTSGGSAPYGYSWSPSGGTAATASNLVAGNYTVTVTDALGCVGSANITISEPTQIAITETIVNENCGQDDGSISVSASGGSGSYNYSWTPNGETTSSITGLTGGNYTVNVTDSDGCSVNESYTVLTVGNIPVIATPISATINAGESVQLNATGADTYVWTPIDGLSCTTCPDPIASPNITTTYIVIGTDAQGCTGADTLTVFVQIQCGDIYVPNVFSPNADINNDFLCIYGSCVSEMTYSVFNRWGELVFSTEGTITMNPGNYQEMCWDGTFKGKPLNSGVYAYKLYARLTNSDVIEQSGNITLVR